MAGQPFSREYWWSLHLATMDLVQQKGLPQVFWTIAPYDWSYPCAEWLLQEMTQSLRPRMGHAVGETLHVVHTMLQIIKGSVLGHCGQPRWENHILKYTKDHGDPRDIAFVIRLEVQDGSRKAPTQGYHGSGRPHFHILLFCDDFQDPPIDTEMSATLFVNDYDFGGIR